MSEHTTQSVIATPTPNADAPFAIIATSRHINIWDKDVEELDVHLNDSEPDLEW